MPELENCDAILQAWYPGEAGGQAVADVLFGDYNPAGRLPVTYYTSTDELPSFEDYSMKNRTYKYYTGKALFPFGYGLSYTSFSYGKAKVTGLSSVKCDIFKISGDDEKGLKLILPVTNTGKRDGEEVVQVYFKNLQDTNAPLKQLCGFTRVFIPAGQTKMVDVPIMNQGLRTYNPETQKMEVRPGRYKLLYGSSSDSKALKSLKISIK